MDHRGWRVHVEHLGNEGAATPVVLLHGFGSGSFTWRPLVATGLVADRTAVAFDRFGFGRTERPAPGSWIDGGPNPYALDGAVDLTIAVLERTAPAPAALIGHSAGALVAVATALARPDLVRGLVLLAPAIVGGGPPPAVAAAFRLPGVRAWAPAVLRAGRPFLGRAVATAWHDRAALRSSGIADDYGRATAEPGWAEGLVELTLATSPADADAVVTRLGEVSVPVLVVTGEHDRIVDAAATRAVATAIRDSELVVVPACGHVPHEEAPKAVVAAVRPFLLSLDRARS